MSEKTHLKEKSTDPAVQEMIEQAEKQNVSTVWDRYATMTPQCGYGDTGLCCRHCLQGPCRIDPFGEGPETGICGASADVMVARGIDRAIAAGTAAHSIHLPKRCLEVGIEPDFFMKTLHHDRYWSAHPEENRDEWIVNVQSSQDHNQQHDNIWCVDAQETAAFFKTCKIPWIAYKIMAAGAIKPEDGFRYAFENGADFTCVGMFDFQVIDNANIVHDTLNAGLKREREWYG